MFLGYSTENVQTKLIILTILTLRFGYLHIFVLVQIDQNFVLEEGAYDMINIETTYWSLTII